MQAASPREVQELAQGCRAKDRYCSAGTVVGCSSAMLAAARFRSWQLPATDLPYAWVAPPPGFVGSAELLAELQLSNSKVVDRQSLHVEWTPPTVSSEPQRDREQIRREQETEAVPPIAPATVQDARERTIINVTPPILPLPSQEQAGKQERGRETAGAHGKKNSRGAAREDRRAQPFERLTVGDGTHSPKGFWDWSR